MGYLNESYKISVNPLTFPIWIYGKVTIIHTKEFGHLQRFPELFYIVGDPTYVGIRMALIFPDFPIGNGLNSSTIVAFARIIDDPVRRSVFKHESNVECMQIPLRNLLRSI